MPASEISPAKTPRQRRLRMSERQGANCINETPICVVGFQDLMIVLPKTNSKNRCKQIRNTPKGKGDRLPISFQG